MAIVKSFKCVRPREDMAEQVASLPYDVYDRKEAKAAVANKPYAFLNIDRPETAFDDDLCTQKKLISMQEICTMSLRTRAYMKRTSVTAITCMSLQ